MFFICTAGNTNGDFSIDATSGEITLVNTLNATETLTHYLEITADDTENQASANLTINIKTGDIKYSFSYNDQSLVSIR